MESAKAKGRSAVTFDRDKLAHLVGAVGHRDKAWEDKCTRDVLSALIDEIARLRGHRHVRPMLHRRS